MSISYSGVVGNKGKNTLPSVEGWGRNKNILRDPPKSIMTRRIDKVNADGSLNDMFYHSGDRFAENINLYARGVNPMVSVEYTNANGAPSKMPYRILNGGAFRPPQLRQEQLLPLSRLPRNVTQVLTNREFKDYSKKISCPQSPKYYREIKKDAVTIHNQILPTKTMNIQVPTKEHFEIKYVIESPLSVSAQTNKQSQGNLQRDSLTRIMKDINQYTQTSGVKGFNNHEYIHSDIELDKNVPTYNTSAGKTQNIQRNIEADHTYEFDKNIPTYNTSAGKTQNIQTHIEADHTYEFDKNIPTYNTSAGKTQNIQRNIEADHTYEFDKNIPIYNTSAGKTQNIQTHIEADHTYEFNKNIPTYNTSAGKTQNIQTHIEADHTYEFDKNMPVYNFVANSTDNTRHIRNEPDSYRQFVHKTQSGIVIPNTRSIADIKPNRTIVLPNSLTIGELQGSKTIPTCERHAQYSSNYSTSKTAIAQSIISSRKN